VTGDEIKAAISGKITYLETNAAGRRLEQQARL